MISTTSLGSDETPAVKLDLMLTGNSELMTGIPIGTILCQLSPRCFHQDGKKQYTWVENPIDISPAFELTDYLQTVFYGHGI